mgnify:CR=1 FL=1
MKNITERDKNVIIQKTVDVKAKKTYDNDNEKEEDGEKGSGEKERGW